MVIGLLFGVGGVVRAQDAMPVATNLWSVKLAKLENTGSAPALAPDGTLYAGTFDGTLSAIGSNGKLKWRFKAGREIQSSPAIGDDGTIYFGSRDRHFYALSLNGNLPPAAGWMPHRPLRRMARFISVRGTKLFTP
jgi:outer membrane protein assembly factor BamB